LLVRQHSDFAFLFRHFYLGGEDLRKGPGIMKGKKEEEKGRGKKEIKLSIEENCFKFL